MINYLIGRPVNIVKTLNNRFLLILEVNQIGYEMQIPSRLARELSLDIDNLQIFTHWQTREDQQILYGFATSAERDLFRQLVSVSGVGMQLAIALIDTLGIETLIQAIVAGNVKTLSLTPGVGKKTAERLALELKTKLAQWRELTGAAIAAESTHKLPSTTIQEDLEMTLLALGYSNEEIARALSFLSQDAQMLKNANVEDWIRSAITWISED